MSERNQTREQAFGEAPDRMYVDWRPGLGVTQGPLTADRQGWVRADLHDALQAENARLREALDSLTDAVTASDRFGDRALAITGPTGNLKWLIEATDEARAALEKPTP